MFAHTSSPEELDARYGKRGFFNPPPTLIAVLTYMAGIEAFDAAGPRPLDSVTLYDRGEGVIVERIESFSNNPRVDIPDAVVEGVTVEAAEEVRKEKSVLGRALVGGLLLGPVGAVVGGISGVGTKKDTAGTPDLLVTIWCRDGSDQAAVVFSAPFKRRAAVEQFFRTTYPTVFGKEPKALESAATSNEAIEQLERLASLRDRGVISEDDFETQRKKLVERL
jgi:hypothetical protein